MATRGMNLFLGFLETAAAVYPPGPTAVRQLPAPQGSGAFRRNVARQKQRLPGIPWNLPVLPQLQVPTAQPTQQQPQAPTAQPTLPQTQAPTAQPIVPQLQVPPTAQPILPQPQTSTVQQTLPQSQAPMAQTTLPQSQAPMAQTTLPQSQAPTAQPTLPQPQAPAAQTTLAQPAVGLQGTAMHQSPKLLLIPEPSTVVAAQPGAAQAPVLQQANAAYQLAHVPSTSAASFAGSTLLRYQ
ncbi:DNA translocase FtsK-like [Ixodes scapularis]|uniref:DNA translocase FtsK-like n=1 Tax=Ixodes scapularis TaxID=6945 RepID=UPI001AD64886|nr:DNA translocase FtsK-like [Ixodes scapularis]